MKRKTTWLVGSIFCGMAATAMAWDSSENAIWLDGSLGGKLSDHVSIKLAEQLRYKDEGKFLAYRHTDIGATYAFNSSWSLTPAFRHIMGRKTFGADWVERDMWHINLNHKTSLKSVAFKSRLRFAYTETDHLSDFRPEFTVLPSKGFSDWKIKPYLADEPMYNFNENRFYRNRASIGLLCAPMKGLCLKAFIMQELIEKTRNGGWNEAFNIGLFVGYTF